MYPFQKEDTRDAVFTDRNGKETETAFMNQTHYYAYYEDEEFQILAKQYEDSTTKMYFVLPKNEGTLTQAAFDEAVANMKSTYISFSVPKFTTESTHDTLVDMLKELGVQLAFDNGNADLSDMFLPEAIVYPPYIGQMIQKTFIAVDEMGTEAGAAAAIGIYEYAVPIEFNCDRPFTYIISDYSTGTILFMGEYAFVE